MNQKELKRLSRSDLLEMMLSLSKENELLRKELHQAKSVLEDRTIAIEQCGSLAEAALKLNGVFQAAQAACEHYSENIRAQADDLMAQAQQKLDGADARCKEIVAQANDEAERIIAQARDQAKQILAEEEKKMAVQKQKYSWITELMENSEEV